MIQLNYFGVVKSPMNRHGINRAVLADDKKLKTYAHRLFETSYDMDGWYTLPNAEQSLIKQIKATAKEIQKNNTTFVVLGIGGSALGAKTLFQAFAHTHRGIDCLVLDNIDPDEFVVQLLKLDLTKTMFNVISKSGNTSETILQMLLVIDQFKKHKIDYTSHFIVTTEIDNGLYQFAKEHNMQTFIVPNNVGGRFSVFSPVGLLPACVYGIDIENLLIGAKTALKSAQNLQAKNNPAFMIASIGYHTYTRKKNELVFMPYSDRLSLMTDYFAQLWAESLCKKYNQNKKVVRITQTPIKSVGVTDQHSQLQLYAEGKPNKTFCFVTVINPKNDLTVKNSVMPSFRHLEGISLQKLLTLENLATAYSLTKQGQLNYTLTLTQIDEEHVGELLFLLQAATAYAGQFFKVNAFDQPGVEEGKIYTKALLGLKGYELQRKEILAYLKQKNSPLE